MCISLLFKVFFFLMIKQLHVYALSFFLKNCLLTEILGIFILCINGVVCCRSCFKMQSSGECRKTLFDTREVTGTETEFDAQACQEYWPKKC